MNIELKVAKRSSAAEPVPDGGSADPGRGGGRELWAGAVRVRRGGHAARAASTHARRHRRVPAARLPGSVAASVAQVGSYVVRLFHIRSGNTPETGLASTW